MRKIMGLFLVFGLVHVLPRDTLRADGVNEEAVEAFRKLGATVTRDEQGAGRPVVAVNFNSAPVTDAGLKELKQYKNLRSLSLGGTKVTDKGMKELRHLQNLDALYLNNTGVTDAGLKEIKGFKSLQLLLKSL